MSWRTSPGIKVADAKISALTAATVAAATNELMINEAGTEKKLTVDLIREFLVKRAAGTSIAAGQFLTWLVLAADSSDLTTLTTVMTITGVGVGRYHFYCQLIYQTTFTTLGHGVAVNHTGTTTQWVVERRYASTGGSSATASGTEEGASATGNAYESQGERTKAQLIGIATLNVDAADTDMISTIEGFFVVSVSGDLEIKLQSEFGTGGCIARQGSFLELEKLS